MTHLRYDGAEALIYDPVASNRSATRAALRSLGFGAIEVATTLDALQQFLKERRPDLLLCEVGGAEIEVCATVQAVRQGKLGEDPFMVIVATTWRRDGTIVNRAVNSGADDLLARPFSASLLGERLRNLIERRKDFVVTSDYIGPDRRRDPSRAGLPGIVVPNTLFIRSTLGLSVADAEAKIAAALREGKRALDTERVRRDANQVFRHWNTAEQRRQSGRDLAPTLTCIASVAADLERRVGNSQYDDALAVSVSIRTAARAASAAIAARGAESAAALEDALDHLGRTILDLRRIVPVDVIAPGQLVELPPRRLVAEAPEGQLAAAAAR